MSPLPANITLRGIPHDHQFYELTTDTPYLCDYCNVAGYGTRLTCTICKYDSHICCAKCPMTLTSSITTHPHPFHLVHDKPEPNQTKYCGSCDHPVEGLAYKCHDCNIYVHPLCAFYWLGETQDGGVPSSSNLAAQSLPELIGTAAGKALVYYVKKWFNGTGTSNVVANIPPAGSN